MISEIRCYAYCREDLSLIENYDSAIADKMAIWPCHHRLEINDGFILSSKELIGLNLYYNRPASELIFLTDLEHKRLHGTYMTLEHKKKISIWSKNRIVSKETREKLSKALKGRKQSEEQRKLNSLCHKGIKHSEEYKRRMSMLHKSLVTEEMRKITSERFKGKPKSEETKRRMSETAKKKCSSEEYRKNMAISMKNSENYKIAMIKRKGEKWWNNGIVAVRRLECPEGFVRGRLSLVKENKK